MGAAARPFTLAPPPVVIAGGTLRRFGRSVYASIEPHSLARGARGIFLRVGARHTDTRIFDRDHDWTLIGTERIEGLGGIQVRLPPLGVLQAGAGAGRFWSGRIAREGPMIAARLDAPGRLARSVDAMAFGGSHPYVSGRLQLSFDVPRRWATLRPALLAGWASTETPYDELHGVGGPETLAGMRDHEWLGRRATALELRFIRHAVGGVDVHAYLQTAHVADPVSRVDLADRLHVGMGMGVRATVPFGPLALDVGFGESGRRRFDLALGQEF